MRPLIGDRSQVANQKFPDPNNTIVTTEYTAGQGPGQARCYAGPGETCDDDGQAETQLEPADLGRHPEEAGDGARSRARA